MAAPESGERSNPILGRTCLRVPLAVVKEATNNFDQQFIIGEGGSAVVYGGQINSVNVAIKRPQYYTSNFRRDFEREISMVSKFHHTNLVPLIGYCDEHDEMILMYEYMDGGTLEGCLHNNPNKPLAWIEFLELIIGAGRAVDYLHRGTDNEVIHRDIKSSNILLDSERTIAKISDFGISRIRPDPNNKGVSTRIQGTPGYLDPACLNDGFTVKTDAYAFAVVMFEMLSGRVALDRSLPKEQQSLAMLWSNSCGDKKKYMDLIDARLKSEISPSCLSEFVKIGYKCLDKDPNSRPTMETVVRKLELAKTKQMENSSSGSILKGLFPNFKKYIPGLRIRKESTKVADCSPSDEPNGIWKKLTTEFIQLSVLTEITGNFSRNILYDHGPKEENIYKGIFTSGNTLFIRRLESTHTNDLSVEKIWSRVSLMSKLQHENVVQLVSYCVNGAVYFLNYEFASNGSVYDHLHRKNEAMSDQFLSWRQRLKIATGTSSGLAYLHEGGPDCNPTVHCDITSRNILLFHDFVPKISDFNIPTQVPDISARSRSEQFLLHTSDADSPEFIEDIIRSNTYSLGVFLLELLTGHEPGDPGLPFAEQNLVKWATPLLTGNELEQCMDPKLQGHYSLRQAKNMAEVALSCVQDDPANRPSMKNVAHTLRAIKNLNLSGRADVLANLFNETP